MRLAAASGVLPVHRAVGRVRDHLHASVAARGAGPARRPAGSSWAGAAWSTRPCSPPSGIDAAEWSGFAFGFGIDRLRADAPRHRRHARPSSRTTSASSRSSDRPTKDKDAVTVRAPLTWLRDFAAFPDDVGVAAAALDDLGLVVEAIEHVGEGLGDVVVARVARDRPYRGRRPDPPGASSTRAAPNRSRSSAGPTTSRPATGCPWPRSVPCCRVVSRSPAARCAASGPTACSAPGRSSVCPMTAPDCSSWAPMHAGDPGTPLPSRSRASSPTWSSTSPWRATGPTPGPSPASPAIWPARLGLPFAAPEPARAAPGGRPVEKAATASVESARPVPAPDRDGARRCGGRALAAPGSPAACSWPGCDRSTTWWTPRTT